MSVKTPPVTPTPHIMRTGKTAGQEPFATGSRIATHSTRRVIGKMSREDTSHVAPVQRPFTAPLPGLPASEASNERLSVLRQEIGSGAGVAAETPCTGSSWKAAELHRFCHPVKLSSADSRITRCRLTRHPHHAGTPVPETACAFRLRNSSPRMLATLSHEGPQEKTAPARSTSSVLRAPGWEPAEKLHPPYCRIRCGGFASERREPRGPVRLSWWRGRSSPRGRGRGGPAAGGRRRGSR